MVKAFVFALASVITAVSVGVAAAQQFPSNVSLSGQVDWITESNTIAYVRVSCGGGTGIGMVTVQLQQSRPPLPPANGLGSVQVICDDTRQVYAVDVFGAPFQLGNAEASVTLTAPSGVKITKP